MITLGVMIGDGKQFQEHFVGDEGGKDDRRSGYSYATIQPWSITCQPSCCVYENDHSDDTTVRVGLEPSGDDAECGQPTIMLYFSPLVWRRFVACVTLELEQHERAAARGGA
mgnify:CR=1 FL=1